MSETCELCRFKLANIRGDGKYRCANQDGPRFGQEAEGGCPQYDRFNPKPDMSFKDALEILLMLPKGAYPGYFFKFGQQGETQRPFLYISFVDNKQMNEWRDAHMVCFDELMRLKREAGDFDGEDIKFGG